MGNFCQVLAFLVWCCCIFRTSRCGCGNYNRFWDVVFVLDESASILAPDWAAQVAMFSDIASAMLISNNSANFGAVMVNNAAKEIFGLTAHSTAASISAALSATTPTGGNSDFGNGLKMAYDMLYTTKRNASTGIIIGASDDGSGDTRTQTPIVKADSIANGYKVLVVGIGVSIPDAATDPSYFFSSMSSPDILDALCPYYCEQIYAMFETPSSGTPDSSTGVGFYLSEYSVPCCGVLKAIEFYANAPGSFDFLVWRSDVVIEKLEVEVQTSGLTLHTFESDKRIAVVETDVFGWFSSSSNIITYTNCSGQTGCPSQVLQAPTVALSKGDTYTWSTNDTVLTDRAYNIKIMLDNNTAPNFNQTSVNTVISDHYQVGASVMEYSFDDPDMEEVFEYSVYEVGTSTPHTYFDGDGPNKAITLRTSLPHSNQPMVHELLVVGEDSCRHFVTGSVTITTFNEPPIFHNLPDTMDLPDNSEVNQIIFSLNVTDLSPSDTVTCVLDTILPDTRWFLLNESQTGSRDIYLDADAQLDWHEVDAYKITVQCTDGIDTAIATLDINVIDMDLTTPYQIPVWAVTTISVGLTAFIVIMGVVCALLIMLLLSTDEAEVLPVREETKDENESTEKWIESRQTNVFSESEMTDKNAKAPVSTEVKSHIS